MTNFNDFGLNNALLKALADEGYETPTPIQTQAIPHVMAGRDLLGIAQTGTGKTAAFALPILHRLAENRRPAPRQGCRVLILAPTRELATQIGQSFRTYGRHMGLTVAVVFGGVSHRPQIAQTRNGVDVLVATPGRLIDHLDERNIALPGTEILVLDEADQMLDMGFIRPIKRILGTLTAKRQNLFFSATMSRETSALAAEILRNPVEVAVTPRAKTADRVAQQVIHIEAPKKRALLVELFSNPALSRALIFTRTKRGADRVARHLDGFGIPVAAIHGNKSQNQREAALAGFKGGRIRALVATDIAARGIDIDEVTHVVNYELPNLPESYVHRIGRTARAGAEGIAISFCDHEEKAYLRDIEKLIRQSIPSSNRCGDASLIVDERTSALPSDGEREPRRHGQRGQPRSGGNRGRGRNDGPRVEVRSAQDGRRSETKAAAPNGRRSDSPRPDRAEAASAPKRQQDTRRAPSRAAPAGEARGSRDTRGSEGPWYDTAPRQPAPANRGQRPQNSGKAADARSGGERRPEPIRFGGQSGRPGGGQGKRNWRSGGGTHAPAR